MLWYTESLRQFLDEGLIEPLYSAGAILLCQAEEEGNLTGRDAW